MAVVARPIAPAVALRGGQFYLRMAVACLAVGVVGFAPTYWLPLVRGTLDVAPLAHLHALFFYGWLLLFVRQTWLAASGRVARHRELGVAGVALATGMVFAGLGMTVNTLKRTEAAGFGDAGRAFSIISFTAIMLFAVLFAIAIANVKRPEIHKRVMLVATISILQAAVGRWFLVFLAPLPLPGANMAAPPPVAVSLGAAILVDLLIVAAMTHDRRTTGRVHAAYWMAGGTVLAVQLLRVPLSTTAAWTTVTYWLLAVSP